MEMQRTETAEAIADAFDLNVATVRRWTQDGCPSAKVNGSHMFNAAEVFTWARDNGKQFRPGRPKGKKSQTLEAARTRKEVALAARYEFELKKAQGEYVSMSEIQEEMSLILHALKRTVLDGPRTIQPPLPRPIRDKVDKALRAALRECAAAMEEAVKDTPS